MLAGYAAVAPASILSHSGGLFSAAARPGQCLHLCLLFIHPPAHGSEVSPAARNTLDSARIPRASKLLICGLFLKGRVLAQDGELTGNWGHFCADPAVFSRGNPLYFKWLDGTSLFRNNREFLMK